VNIKISVANPSNAHFGNMNSKGSARIERIASHFASTSTSESTDQTWHRQTGYSFEPGRLLLGQVALITGAGSGIGRACAILFAHHGAKVVACDLDAAAAHATADFIRNSAGDSVAVVQGDVTAPEFPKKAVDKAIDAFGALHILVLNAGYTWDRPVHRMREKEWQSMLDVHLTANFRIVQASAPYMREAAKKEIEDDGKACPRSIITLGSVSGTHGSAAQVNYSAAKAGLVGFTKSLAREWGMFNIRVNCIVPGYITTRLTGDRDRQDAVIEVDGETVQLGIPGGETQVHMARQMIAMGRVGAPEEVAGSILMLACPYASYITGQVIEVTGGGWL
jgi:3-oxoacyl-[acyl-carrier protein] reductase